ncbi:hypothetical protein [Peribacillus sp. TH14]|uniref:hypothetical protein n=1 Tax=Peribacillus sp. TH14 TaxID=2798481 RepID=UPI001F5B670D|nr:hypothetical protein [Peribacillus sp. TH14]
MACDTYLMKCVISSANYFEGEETATVAGLVAEGLGIAVLPKISDIQMRVFLF